MFFFSQCLARKDEVVKGLTDGVKVSPRKKNQIDAVSNHDGSPRRSVVVKDDHGNGTKLLETKHILIPHTGSRPISLHVHAPPTAETIVKLGRGGLFFEKVPDAVVVVGGGYIGLELGSVWKRLGSKVTVVEFLPRIVPIADLEMGSLLHKSLAKQGLEFQLETKVTGAKAKGEKVVVSVESKDSKHLSYRM